MRRWKGVVITTVVALGLIYVVAAWALKPRPLADVWPYSEHWWPGLQCDAADGGYDDKGCPTPPTHDQYRRHRESRHGS
jgi:hypothetical protein